MKSFHEKVYLLTETNWLTCLDFTKYDPTTDPQFKGIFSKKFPLCPTYKVCQTSDVVDFAILPKKIDSRREVLELFQDLYSDKSADKSTEPQLWKASELVETEDSKEQAMHQVFYLRHKGIVVRVEGDSKETAKDQSAKHIFKERSTILWMGLIRTVNFNKSYTENPWSPEQVVVAWGYDKLHQSSVLKAVTCDKLVKVASLVTQSKCTQWSDVGEAVHSIVEIPRIDYHCTFLCLVGVVKTLQLCVLRRRRLYHLHTRDIDHRGSMYYACRLNSWSFMCGSYIRRGAFKMSIE